MSQDLINALRAQTTKRVSKALEEGEHKAIFIAAVEDTTKGIITIHYQINNRIYQQRYTDIDMYDRDITRLGRQLGLSGDVDSKNLWDKEVNVSVKYNGDFTNIYPYSKETKTTATVEELFK